MSEQQTSETKSVLRRYTGTEINEIVQKYIYEQFDELARNVFVEYKTFDSESARKILRDALLDNTASIRIGDVSDVFRCFDYSLMSDPEYDVFSDIATRKIKQIKKQLLLKLHSEEPFAWPL